MKKGWIVLYALLILTVPCLAFAASGSVSQGSGPASAGPGSDTATTDITGAKAAETMQPYAGGERYRIMEDPYRPGAYKIIPVRPEDTGASGSTGPDASVAGTDPGTIYRLTPDPNIWGAYLAVPEPPAARDTGSHSGSGASRPSSSGSTRAD